MRSAMGKARPTDLLPEITVTRRYAKLQKLKERRKLRELQRENPRAAAALAKANAKKALAAKKAASQGKGKINRSATKTAAKEQNDRKVKKTRKPKTVIANAPTGRETLVKAKARELVQQQKKERQTAKAAAQTNTATTRRHGRGSDSNDVSSSAAPSPVDLDRLLIEKTVRGADANDLPGIGAGPAGMQDPALYPTDVAFYADYAEQRHVATVSEDALLKQANDHFRRVGQEERRMNVAAARYLQKMKEVNRKGGDRDGFRYVLPKNVKAVVKMMRQNALLAAGKGTDATAVIDDDNLRSTFGGDDADEANDKPVRRRKKRRSSFSDFYQFQVSKRWTKNAESFLNRGRAHKSLFEAKKRQRSIKKL